MAACGILAVPDLNLLLARARGGSKQELHCAQYSDPVPWDLERCRLLKGLRFVGDSNVARGLLGLTVMLLPSSSGTEAS
jgi:hypothetical protein